MMVTIMVMIIVLFALYNIFDMSIRVFSFGNDKVEAVENARLGLEKTERELRAAYPYNKPGGQKHRFWAYGSPTSATVPPANSNQITFGNDLNGDRAIDVATEQITYSLDGTTLKRAIGTGTAQPVVEFVKRDNPATAAYDGGLKFNPLTSGDGTPPTEAQVAKVRVELEIDKDGRTQVLSSDVDLRNRGG